jgi:succinate dehydrogenase/fumarate reductase flavoprotein subunit
MGGVAADSSAATEVEGLYAVGEVCGGLHGANRLGGNSLSEVFAMGGVAGEAAAAASARPGPGLPAAASRREAERLAALVGNNADAIEDLRRALKELMWRSAGVLRSREGLERGLEEIEALRSAVARPAAPDQRSLIRALELRNMIVVAEMVLRAALHRSESRGAHWRVDYPGEDHSWQRSVLVRRKGSRITVD